mgnify:CR=1 FL=1
MPATPEDDHTRHSVDSWVSAARLDVDWCAMNKEHNCINDCNEHCGDKKCHTRWIPYVRERYNVSMKENDLLNYILFRR